MAVLSAAAATLQKAFTPYYDTFMPGLIQILQTARAKEQRELRGRAVEAIGLIGTGCDAVNGEMGRNLVHRSTVPEQVLESARKSLHPTQRL